MKNLRTGFLFLLILLLTGCVSSPNMQRIDTSMRRTAVSSNVTSQILNLKYSGNSNISIATADRIMKNGFLSTGEEYGYYTLNITSSYADSDLGFWGVTGSILMGIPFLLGVPTNYNDFDLTLKMDILDSNMNIIKSYSDSTTIRQWGGMYYGDATDKASAAFSNMLRNIQRRASADSTSINTALRAAGPIRTGQGGQTASTQGQPQNGIVGALIRAAGETMKNVPGRSRIAIVYITAPDKGTTDYITGELEYIWFNSGYVITDRSELDRLRREQNFQLSGEVDDATAVSIGKFAGANIIVTGRVDGEGNLRRLRLRAIDTQTALVVGVASESF